MRLVVLSTSPELLGEEAQLLLFFIGFQTCPGLAPHTEKG